MTGIEIVLLAAGAITFTLSFMLPSTDEEEDKNSGKSSSLDKKLESMNSTDEQEIRKRVRQIADDEAEEAENTTKRSLEKMTNEKIMAVDEYSKTVLDAIEKNHQEVVFLYDMLNNKSADLKNTIRKAEQTKREVEAERKAEEERAAQISKAAKALKAAEADKVKNVSERADSGVKSVKQSPFMMPSPEEIEAGIGLRENKVKTEVTKKVEPAADKVQPAQVKAQPKPQPVKQQSTVKTVQPKTVQQPKVQQPKVQPEAKPVQKTDVKPAAAHAQVVKKKASSEEAMEKLLESMSTGQVRKKVSAMDRLKKQAEPEPAAVPVSEKVQKAAAPVKNPIVEEFEPMPAIVDIDDESEVIPEEVTEPVQEAVKASAEESVHETAQETVQEPVQETEAEPVLEAAPKTEDITVTVSEPDMAEKPQDSFERQAEDEVYSSRPVSVSMSGLSRNEQVLEMHHSGKTSIEIAKTLAMGVGEVNLVIGLYDRGRKEDR
ncbi:MAG: hypothetical protein K6F39_05455 [Lachnospiraceae bacterium]|nr:hypothetical protein [Lachnospiraceae bacterium]